MAQLVREVDLLADHALLSLSAYTERTRAAALIR